jgi:hypothetical protein
MDVMINVEASRNYLHQATRFTVKLTACSISNMINILGAKQWPVLGTKFYTRYSTFPTVRPPPPPKKKIDKRGGQSRKKNSQLQCALVVSKIKNFDQRKGSLAPKHPQKKRSLAPKHQQVKDPNQPLG